MKRYLVKPGQQISLDSYDPNDTETFEGGKDKARELVRELNQKLNDLQEMLYAEHKKRVLVVLQGMDTSGKDGVIRSVFEGVNPQGVKVASFKVPTPLELDHDYLWRIHPKVPGKGEIVIFNRSHYEDILAVRVHNLVPEKTWGKRFNHIRSFESMLADEGVTILKFFLHISLEEQKARFIERLAKKSKNWKFNPNDLEERKLWPEYTRAYEDVLTRTSLKDAPWYIVPSDKKWYRNLVISTILVNTLKGLKMNYPASFNEEMLETYRQMTAES